MNRRATLLMVAVLGGMSWYLFSNTTQVATRHADRARQLRLEQAVTVVEATFGGMADAGYTAWTPTTVATQLAKTMTAAETLTPDEAKELGLAGRTLPRPTQYVVGKPTGPWQVVLVPDEQHKLVRIEGYGTDLEHPLIVKQLAIAY